MLHSVAGQKDNWPEHLADSQLSQPRVVNVLSWQHEWIGFRPLLVFPDRTWQEVAPREGPQSHWTMLVSDQENNMDAERGCVAKTGLDWAGR